jgi:lipopolysaccharide export LptBFGC system permease protein LptF
MTILILPPFIVEILPIATVLSIIYTWSHLQEVKEITIMKSFGISNFKLSIAGILLGIFNTLLALFIPENVAHPC